MSVRTSNVTPDLSSYNDKPTIKGIEGVQAFLEAEGLDVGHNALRDAVFYKKTPMYEARVAESVGWHQSNGL